MAINKNFVVKNGLEVNTDQIFADSSSGKVGIGSTLPTVELDVQGAIAATDVVSSLLRVTGYSTLPQVTVTDNMVISGITTGNHINALGISSLSNLRVVGVTTFENDVNLNGNVNATGFSTFVGLTSVANLKVAGVSTFVGFSTFNDYVTIQDGLNVSGVSTFTGAADFNSNVDIDGHTELDDVNVSGASTFTGAADFNGDIDVDGHTELDDVNVSGVSTFTGAADFNGDIDVDGHTELDNLNVAGFSTFVGFATFSNDVQVAGVITATSFVGEGQIGVGSEGSFIGTGVTMIDFKSSNTQNTVDLSSGIATVTVQTGISIGLAVALGG